MTSADSMKNKPFQPVDVAQQILAIESLVGADWFLPANRNPLPAASVAAAATAASQPAARPAVAPAASGRPVVAAPAAVPASSAEQLPELPPEQKAAALTEMDNNEVKACKKCVLCQTRTQTVFGYGSPTAELVFVGEAPGKDEDEQGIPFIGRAGQLLTKMISAMGLSREQVFICNTLKCRPPGNRPPAPEEIQACWNYLIRQLQIIRPKAIVTLGNPATQNLLQTRIGITKMRGQWHPLPDLGPGLAGIPVMPSFHPSFIIRRYTPEIRGKAWNDLQMVMAHLGLSVPKKA